MRIGKPQCDKGHSRLFASRDPAPRKVRLGANRIRRAAIREILARQPFPAGVPNREGAKKIVEEQKDGTKHQRCHFMSNYVCEKRETQTGACVPSRSGPRTPIFVESYGWIPSFPFAESLAGRMLYRKAVEPVVGFALPSAPFLPLVGLLALAPAKIKPVESRVCSSWNLLSSPRAREQLSTFFPFWWWFVFL